MKADLSRSTFDPMRHYNGVLMQQGRVLLDADWNEQHAIQRHRTETGTADLIGSRGVPIDPSGESDGFAISLSPNNTSFVIGPGHLYVDGVFCENTRTSDGPQGLLYEDQDPTTGRTAIDDLLQVSAVEKALVYLDVWDRHLTALDHSSLREQALDGPDTTTRTQTYWRVRAQAVPATTECGTPIGTLVPAAAPPNGQLKAEPATTESASSPCQGAATSGYSGTENQLYRVEINKGGTVAGSDPPTFVWARDNASVVVPIVGFDGTKIVTIAANGQEARFESGTTRKLVHIFDDLGDVLAGVTKRSGFFIPASVNWEERSVTLDSLPDELKLLIEKALCLNQPTGTATCQKQLLKLRIWDGDERCVTANSPFALDPESNLTVTFSEGQFQTGDYWLIPARAGRDRFEGGGEGTIEWPTHPGTREYLFQPRHGVVHHVCPLALVSVSNGAFVPESLRDCRPRFPRLTELVRLLYRSGSGQVVQPDSTGALPLTKPLAVQLVNWNTPIEGALVQFTIVDTTDGDRPNGMLLPATSAVDVRVPPTRSTLTVFTETGERAGIADVRWQPDPDLDPAEFVIEATLVGATEVPPIRFTVSKVEQGDAATINVFRVNSVWLLTNQGTIEKPLPTTWRPLYNDSEITVDELMNGIAISCTDAIDPASLMYTAPVATPSSLPSDQTQVNENQQLTIDDDPVWRGNKPVATLTVERPHLFTLRTEDLDPQDETVWQLSRSRPVGGTPVSLRSRLSRADQHMLLWEPIDNRMALKSDLEVQEDNSAASLLRQSAQPTRRWLNYELRLSHAARETETFLPGEAHEPPSRLLARLTAKGSAIWSTASDSQSPDGRIYLDGQRFGLPNDRTTTTELDWTTRAARQRGSDFDLWFWIARHMGIGLILDKRFTPAMVEVIDLGIVRSELQPEVNQMLEDKEGVRRLIGEGEYEFVAIDQAETRFQIAYEALTDDEKRLLAELTVSFENFLVSVAPKLQFFPTSAETQIAFTRDDTGFGDFNNPTAQGSIDSFVEQWNESPTTKPAMIIGSRLTADLLRERTDHPEFNGAFVRF